MVTWCPRTGSPASWKQATACGSEDVRGIFLVVLILLSWVLVAHAIGEFLDRMVRLELNNEKVRKKLMLRRPRHEVFDDTGQRRLASAFDKPCKLSLLLSFEMV